MSILNPNVFFEFGIRTALDKPVALVVDDITSKIPFDTSIINFHKYDHRLDPWILKDEISNLKSHIVDAYEKSNNRNSLWKYFGIKQAGTYAPENVELGEKLDLIMSEISSLKDTSKISSTSLEAENYHDRLTNLSLLVRKENLQARLADEKKKKNPDKEEISKLEMAIHLLDRVKDRPLGEYQLSIDEFPLDS